MDNAFGEFFVRVRIKGGKTIRKFCLDGGFSASYISRLERGLQPPPKSEAALTSYALALCIRENTDEWVEFFDLAAIGVGMLPVEILDDAELLKKLPLLLRTIHGKKLSANKLDELIEMIRKA